MTKPFTLIQCSKATSCRRDFLRATAAGSFALAAGVPTFLSRLSAAADKESDRILVVF